MYFATCPTQGSVFRVSPPPGFLTQELLGKQTKSNLGRSLELWLFIFIPTIQAMCLHLFVCFCNIALRNNNLILTWLRTWLHNHLLWPEVWLCLLDQKTNSSDHVPPFYLAIHKLRLSGSEKSTKKKLHRNVVTWKAEYTMAFECDFRCQVNISNN